MFLRNDIRIFFFVNSLHCVSSHQAWTEDDLYIKFLALYQHFIIIIIIAELVSGPSPGSRDGMKPPSGGFVRNKACYTSTGVDEIKLTKWGRKHWWNEICCRGKPAQNLIRPPPSPRGVIKTRTRDPGGGGWATTERPSTLYRLSTIRLAEMCPIFM